MTQPRYQRSVTPRWPRDRWISPSVLKVYRNCPKRLRLQYIENIPRPWAYELHLRKGTIAHNILRDIAYLFRGGHPLIGDDVVLQRAVLRMPLELFPSPLERDAHAHDITRWVSNGVRYLSRIPDLTFLLIEKNLHREHGIYQGRQPYTLLVRPDVILLRGGEDNQPLVEIIDYKTGAIRPEEDPPVMMRFVGDDLLRQAIGDASTTRVRFTYLWLEHADMTQIDLSAEYCRDHAPTLTRRLHALVSETEWAATPSFLCKYCPYHGNVCQEKIPPGHGAGFG
jgi:hypothetical protein